MICPNCNNYNDDSDLKCVYCDMVFLDIPKKKKNHAKLIAVIVGSIIAIACITIGIFMVSRINTRNKYEEKLSMADKYLAEGNYHEAIIAYNEALELNGDDEELYIQLAIAYEEIGDKAMVDEILTRGYQHTKSERLRGMLSNLLSYGSIFDMKSTEAVEETDNGQIFINQEFLDTCLNSGYQDYVNNYGNGVFTRESGGDAISFTYSNPDIKIFYVNADTNVFDVSTGIPYGNTKPSYIVLNRIDVLFDGFTDIITYEDVCEIFNEEVVIKDGVYGTYLDVSYYGCKLQLGCDASGNIVSRNAWNKVIESGAGENEIDNEFDGTASGKIINASTGYGISDVYLAFREGSNNQYGDVVFETRTDNQGNYTVNLDEGRYTVCAEADGFTMEFFEINVVKGMTMAGQNLTMSSTLNDGQVRIVLEWGENPRDLDAHLRTGFGEVYYGNKEISGVASLDVDDTNGFGPETILIDDISSGSYTYLVQDFTNSGDSGSTALGSSGAIVKVYMPGESEPAIFYVPAGAGTTWEVFSITGGQITTINNIY